MSEEQKSRETASQNEVSQEGTEPKRTDVERVEEAGQAIVRAIETGSDRFWEAQVEAQQKAAKPKNPLVSTMLFVASTWVVFFAIISALTFLAGWALYEVRPLHALERIGREQQQADAKEYLGALHVNLGNSLLNVGRVEQAQAEFEKALEIDPLNTDAEQGRIECALFLGVQKIQSPNSEAAIIDEKLTTLINAQEDALKPKNGLLGHIMDNSKDQTETYQRLSQLYAFQGDYFYYYDHVAAVDSYKTAIEFNDQNAVAYSGLSTNYYERGEFDLAEKNARLAWKTAKWDSLLETNYADAMLANGHYEKASQRYKDVILWDRHYI